MLRRKLILNLGPPMLLLVVTAITALWLLQGVLHRLDDSNRAAREAAPASQALQAAHTDSAEGVPAPAAADERLERESLTRQLRGIVMGLGIVFLLVINVSIVMLVRMAGMVLRPVDTLLEGTRELCREHFDHRVQLGEHDEFDELARAYNTLAEHLQATDRRQIEVLGQVALAMNHELNNSMATIELQLGLLRRGGAAGDPQAERRLRTIHDSLTRMKDTVQSLKSVRRIVLTDYGPGVKMLDLVQSAREEQGPARPPQVTSA